MRKTISWSDVDALADQAARRVRDSGFQPDAVVGIAKGGWIPARLLCSRLKIKRLHSYGLVYSDAARTKVDMYSEPTPPLQGLSLLLVEDMVESGRMQNIVFNRLQTSGNIVRTLAFFDLATTTHKPHVVLETLHEVPSFPWERGLTDEGV